MVDNREAIRKTIYLVAGILPAIGFGILSLVAIMVPPLAFWTLAAWTGVVGLIRAFNRSPYHEMHGRTAVMLICGVVAMAPIAIIIVPHELQGLDRLGNLAGLLMLLGSVGTLLIAAHYLYFQTILLLASWLSSLVPYRDQITELKHL